MNDRWLITFSAEGPGPPMPIRIRKLLKYALRAQRLRCVEIRQQPTQAAARAAKETSGSEPDEIGQL